MDNEDVLVYMVLQRMSHCPSCHHAYHGTDAHVVGSTPVGDGYTVHSFILSCSHCQQRYLVSALVVGPPPWMDVTVEEWECFHAMSPISWDDVLDMKLALRELDTLPETLLGAEEA